MYVTITSIDRFAVLSIWKKTYRVIVYFPFMQKVEEQEQHLVDQRVQCSSVATLLEICRYCRTTVCHYWDMSVK